MNRLAKFAIAGLAAGIPATASAQVEYSIEMDPAFPSVVYVEYDPSTMPQIYTAPGSGSGSGLPVIRGGEVEGSGSGGAAQQPVDSDTTSSNSKDSGSGGGETVGQRAENRVRELLDADGEKLQDIMIDREIEDRVLDRLQN